MSNFHNSYCCNTNYESITANKIMTNTICSITDNDDEDLDDDNNEKIDSIEIIAPNKITLKANDIIMNGKIDNVDSHELQTDNININKKIAICRDRLCINTDECCDICNNKEACTLTWQGKDFKKSICMDCIFDSALSKVANDSFNSHAKEQEEKKNCKQ